MRINLCPQQIIFNTAFIGFFMFNVFQQLLDFLSHTVKAVFKQFNLIVTLCMAYNIKVTLTNLIEGVTQAKQRFGNFSCNQVGDN